MDFCDDIPEKLNRWHVYYITKHLDSEVCNCKLESKAPLDEECTLTFSSSSLEVDDFLDFLFLDFFPIFPSDTLKGKTRRVKSLQKKRHVS